MDYVYKLAPYLVELYQKYIDARTKSVSIFDKCGAKSSEYKTANAGANAKREEAPFYQTMSLFSRNT